jgi:prepilin-type N-terminal cleavage/methylation domain-containing protein
MRVRSADQGFSMIELMIVVLVIGILAAFTVPSAVYLSQGMQLDGAANSIAGELRLARSKAMATGVDQMMHFSADSLNSDYHIHAGNTVPSSWKLPTGVTYTTNAFQSITMLSTGRASTSTFVILKDRRGDIDTVSVESSGLIFVY